MSRSPKPATAVDAPAALSHAGADGVRGQRIHFVDLLRLLGSLQMVHGHSIDAVLAEELRQGVVFSRWSWGRGLVSVAFLLAAGISYHLSTIARFEAHRADRDKVGKRFRRALWLIALGYLLHFPAGIFGGDAAAALREFAMVDILQCIGLCIVALELAMLFARSARQVVIASAVLAGLAFVLAPLGERLDPSGAWRPIVNYVTHQGGSLFPVLPWAGFVFAGVIAGELVLPRGTRTPIEAVLPRLVGCTVAVLAIALCAELVPLSLVDEHTSRNSEPAFNLLKLGVVLAIVVVLHLIGRRITRMPRVMTILAGESLMLYVSHLILLYSGGVGLYWLVGHTLSLPASLSLATLMVPLVAAIGLGWYRVKQWRASRPTAARAS